MRSYSEALKADKQLGSYISQRKKLQEQGFDKTSDAYKSIQNKINAAYGVSKRYEMSDDFKKAQAAVSGGSKKLNTPSPGTTNVNRSTGGGTTGNTLMNRANATPPSPDPKMTSAPGALPTIKKGESMSAAVGSKDNTMATVSKAEGGSRAYRDPNPGQPMIRSSAEVIPSKGMDFAAMEATAKQSYASKKPSTRSDRKFNRQVAKLQKKNMPETDKIAEKSRNFGMRTKTKTVKLGAERDVSGNIVQGGRAAGTYERTKTVSIDPTTGKKVRTREYKRIT